MPSPEYEARLIAATDMLGRTGAKSIQFRYSDNEEPTVWMAIVEYPDPNPLFERSIFVATGDLDQLQAVLELCEKVIDGSTCTHCKRPAGFEPDFIDTMPLNSQVCWYQYDPELKKFRRGCEGSDA